MGRLAEALAVWAPALSAGTGAALTRDRYLMLTRYLLVAIDLPVPLGIIEEALQQAEAGIQAAYGGAAPRSRLLLARSRLALALGRPADAVALGLEGLARCKREGPRYAYSAHFRTLTRAGLLVRRPELVADLIEDWEAIEYEYPHAKRIAITAARANLARFRGEPEAALDLAERILDQAVGSEDVRYASEACVAVVRAQIAAGVPNRARPVLAHLLRLRRRPLGDLRFEVLLLLGDYHLAAAILETQGVAVDPEFGGEHRTEATTAEAGPSPQRYSVRAGGVLATAAGHAARAAAAYAGAHGAGARLDQLLGTEHWRALVEERRAQLGAWLLPAR